MCSLFEMENTGDLTDIIRASGGIYGCGEADSNSNTNPSLNWQFSSEPMNFYSDSQETFGDPFSSTGDPLRQLHDISASSSSGIINAIGCEESVGFPGVFSGGSMILHQRIFRDEIRTPRNIFSREPQISPSTKLPLTSCDPPLMVNSPTSIKSSSMVSNHIINPIGLNSCLVDNSTIQISSPRNTGIKRRKSQAKNVVCIPAPAPANSRPSGEVVPSDLWAWRKYGQKPIKGSPYPRGYYRCSSSKGCSARKQVERSRIDPNMLVITYTSEHNHPWPTQRNALAGSTRSQPSRNGSNGDASKSSNGGESQKMTISKEEEVEEEQMKENGVSSGLYVKEEMEENDQIKGLEMEDEDQFIEAVAGCSAEDFFADMGEIQTDNSLNLIFAEAFSGSKQKDGKTMKYPFPLFDWTANNSTPNSSSFHQQRKDS